MKNSKSIQMGNSPNIKEPKGYQSISIPKYTKGGSMESFSSLNGIGTPLHTQEYGYSPKRTKPFGPNDDLKSPEHKSDINFSLNPARIKGSTGSDQISFYLKTSHTENPRGVILPSLQYTLQSFKRVGRLPTKSSIGTPIHTVEVNDFSPLVREIDIRTSPKAITSTTQQDEKSALLGVRSRERKVDLNKSVPSVLGDSELNISRYDDKDVLKKAKILAVKNKNLKRRVDELEKENVELKELVQSYRSMLVKNSIGVGGVYNRSLSPRQGEVLSPGISGPVKHHGYSNIDQGFFDKLSALYKMFARHKSIYYTMEAAVNEAIKVMDSGSVRIILTHKEAKKMYAEAAREKGKGEKMTLGKTEVEIIEKKDEITMGWEAVDVVDNIFGLKKPFNNDGKGLSCPIFSVNEPEEMWGAIQITEAMTTLKHTRIKRSRGFVLKDEALLEMYAKVVSLLIDAHQREQVIRDQVKKALIFNDTVTQMVIARTHQELLDSIKSRMTSHFGFEGLGILYYSSKDDIMYTYDVQRRPDGKFYSIDPLRYPVKLGISGSIITRSIEILVLNEPRKNKIFQPEIDNTTGVPQTKNILLALLKDDKGNKTGVLQLINKLNDQNIEPQDEGMVRDLSKLLGAMISHVNDIYFAINLSASMKKTMKAIETSFTGGGDY